ncbi:hypothetical protein Ddye_001842 [Dipteronia dyeriana]|uniref:Uncharacterized protein n=1 Tax=Dipteronia dyeriana TaxID=168575 RepID=A0AAE0CUD9_9ROSI|nr:hypothetical protein Ddye_001842 [Dipteronia dyeriana]
MAVMVTEMMIPMEEAEVLIVTKIAQSETPIDDMLLVMTVNHHVEAVEAELMIIMLKEGMEKFQQYLFVELLLHLLFLVLLLPLQALIQAKQLMLLPLGTNSPVNQEVVTSDDFHPHGSAPGCIS